MPQFTVLSDYRGILSTRRGSGSFMAGEVFDSSAFGENLEELISNGLLITANVSSHDVIIARYNSLKDKAVGANFFAMMQESGLLPSASAPRLITQPTWFVNEDTGDDMNSGETESSALKSLPGLNRAWVNGSFEQPTRLEVRGNHLNESLNGHWLSATNGSLLVKGMAPTELEGPLVLAAVTAPVMTVGGEGTTLDVTGFDFTPFLGQRIRFTTGAATGSICQILAVNPNGSGGTARIRVSDPGQQLSEFQVFDYNTTLPSVNDEFVIETLTQMGGVDISIVGALKANPDPLIRRTQFQDFDMIRGFAHSHISIDDKEGPIIFGCNINAVLDSPSETSLDFCLVFSVTEGSGTLIADRSAFTIMGVARGGVLVSRNCIYQGFPPTIAGGNVAFEQGNSTFDADVGIDALTGADVDISGPYYGTGIADVGIQVASGVAVTFSTVPTIAGTNGAARIGGTPVLTYPALPTDPILGAGIYQR